MKNIVRNTTIFTSTLVLVIGALLLLIFSVQSNNYAISSRIVPETKEKISLPSGTRYKKVEYGQSFSLYELFFVTPKDRLNLTVNASNYSLTKIGTTDINVTFKKNGLTSSGLVRLTVIDSQKPIIKTQDTTIYVNDSFNPLEGVTAEDNVDKNLTDKIKVDGSVNTNLAGEYSLTYTVEDSSKNISRLLRTITVLPIVEEVTNQSLSQNNSTVEAPIIASPSETTVPSQNSTLATPEPATGTQPAIAPLPTNILVIAGVTIPYQNGGQGAGQSIIDANAYGTASTWGGAPIQSGVDGMNTHFIGHNPGIFSILFSVGIGSAIVVTDSTGQATTYIVNNILHVDDYGNDLSTSVNQWDLTVGTGGGERITLQTCISDTENLMVLASK